MAQYAVAVVSVVLATLAALPFYPGAVDFPVLLLLAAVAYTGLAVSLKSGEVIPADSGTARLPSRGHRRNARQVSWFVPP